DVPSRSPANGHGSWVFFDRGLIDAAAGLEHLTGEPVLATVGQAHRYHQRVFLAPPWPEIYVADPERRHGLDAAVVEYQRLLGVYPSLGYQVIILPKVGVCKRATFVLNTLAQRLGRTENHRRLGVMRRTSPRFRHRFQIFSQRGFRFFGSSGG